MRRTLCSNNIITSSNFCLHQSQTHNPKPRTNYNCSILIFGLRTSGLGLPSPHLSPLIRPLRTSDHKLRTSIYSSLSTFHFPYSPATIHCCTATCHRGSATCQCFSIKVFCKACNMSCITCVMH